MGYDHITFTNNWSRIIRYGVDVLGVVLIVWIYVLSFDMNEPSLA